MGHEKDYWKIESFTEKSSPKFLRDFRSITKMRLSKTSLNDFRNTTSHSAACQSYRASNPIPEYENSFIILMRMKFIILKWIVYRPAFSLRLLTLTSLALTVFAPRTSVQGEMDWEYVRRQQLGSGAPRGLYFPTKFYGDFAYTGWRWGKRFKYKARTKRRQVLMLYHCPLLCPPWPDLKNESQDWARKLRLEKKKPTAVTIWNVDAPRGFKLPLECMGLLCLWENSGLLQAIRVHWPL